MIGNRAVPLKGTEGRNKIIPDNHVHCKKRNNLKKEVEKELGIFIKENDHPCLSAQSVLNNKAIVFETYEQLGSRSAAIGIAKDLSSFLKQRNKINARFTSFIAVFKNVRYLSEIHFEQLLWKQLSYLHERDNLPWDNTVNDDTESPDFSFSFEGNAFYIIGLHPGSSRKARQFKYPAMVFNLHSQFETLRAKGQYEKMKSAIRARDIKLQGSINPMMEDHGTSSEAKQYSGRQVDDSWKCPFHKKP